MTFSLRHIFMPVAAGAFALMASGITVKAEPPPEGSEQWNKLSPYRDFIVAMRSPNGRSSCCDMADGRADLEERTVNGQYQVRITKELYPNAYIPQEGMWINVEPNAILTPEEAFKHCAPIRASQKNHTCVQPPFNVLWLNTSNNTPYCYIRREVAF